MPIISGEGIHLVPFTDNHLNDPKYLSWLHDYDVMKLINRPEYLLPIDFEHVKKYVKDVSLKNDDYMFAIEIGEKRVFIGTFKIDQINWTTRTVNLGVMVGDRDYWGKGIGTKAFKIATKFCFDKLGFTKVHAGCNEKNIGMIKVVQKLGFKQDGCFRNHDLIEGELTNHLYFSILKEEYEQNKKLYA